MTDTKEIKSQKQADQSNEDNLLKQDADSAQTGMEEDLLDDENTIDRLLMKEDFAGLEEIPGEENTAQSNASAEDEFDEFAADENDLLQSEPQAESMESVDNDKNDDFLMADFDISGDDEFAGQAAAETAAPADEPPPSPEEEPTASSETSDAEPQEAASGIELAELSGRVDTLQNAIESLQAMAVSQPEELEKLTREQKKSTKALDQTLQKSALLGKGALATAILALIGIGVMAVLFFGSQGDIEQLQEKVIAMEDDLAVLVGKQNAGELQQVKQNVSQLTTKIADLSTQFAALQDKLVSGTLPAPTQDDAIQQGLSENSTQIADTNKQLAALTARIAKLEKRKTAVRKTKASTVKTGWAVNLISFKQKWYAQRKSEELKKKGIPVEVLAVKIKGENWYRLRVGGFKSKHEASSYASRIKKTLNLSSVWVARN